MSYSLTVWTHPENSDDIRLYINGTTRSKVWLCAKTDGTTGWNSETAKTPAKFRKGNHYGKVAKDADAAFEVAEMFGITIGETLFSDAISNAALGLIVEG